VDIGRRACSSIRRLRSIAGWCLTKLDVRLTRYYEVRCGWV